MEGLVLPLRLGTSCLSRALSPHTVNPQGASIFTLSVLGALGRQA